ncbi:MAG: hypothetical protein AAGA46_03425 [Cyanobacteria bacterium P01_F01_bin.13]
MFELEDFAGMVQQTALDPTPDTPQTPLDNIQIVLTGCAAISCLATLVYFARLIPPALPGVVMGLTCGALALVVYGLLQGYAARVKAIAYGLCGLLGVVLAGHDFILMQTGNAGVIGGIALGVAGIVVGGGICWLLKGIASNA